MFSRSLAECCVRSPTNSPSLFFPFPPLVVSPDACRPCNNTEILMAVCTSDFGKLFHKVLMYVTQYLPVVLLIWERLRNQTTEWWDVLAVKLQNSVISYTNHGCRIGLKSERPMASKSSPLKSAKVKSETAKHCTPPNSHKHTRIPNGSTVVD